MQTKGFLSHNTTVFNQKHHTFNNLHELQQSILQKYIKKTGTVLVHIFSIYTQTGDNTKQHEIIGFEQEIFEINKHCTEIYHSKSESG